MYRLFNITLYMKVYAYIHVTHIVAKHPGAIDDRFLCVDLQCVPELLSEVLKLRFLVSKAAYGPHGGEALFRHIVSLGKGILDLLRYHLQSDSMICNMRRKIDSCR